MKLEQEEWVVVDGRERLRAFFYPLDRRVYYQKGKVLGGVHNENNK
jgi:hypothetical protein